MERQREQGRYKTFVRRTVLVGGAQTALLSILVGRLYYLQVVRSEQYRMLADENRISLRLLAPPRGFILDRNGDTLAGNSQNYRILLVPEQTKTPGMTTKQSVDRTLQDLAKVIPLADYERQRILREVGRKREFLPITVAENVTWEDFSRINVNAPDLPGIVPDVSETRNYPLGPTLAHVVGYVAAVADGDVIDDPVLELPGFKIGRAGIERSSDLMLRGKAGTSHVEVNAHGRVIRELDRLEGRQGQDVFLTIDGPLQQFVTDRLGAEAASAVVMDVVTGDILAMASTPSFDPINFTYGLSKDQWDALVTNQRKPLINKAVSGQYPPGSTFKPMVALAALESNVVGSDHKVFCPGQMELGDRIFHCWKKGGHGNLDMAGALEQSCDVYFYDIARRIGIDRIAEMAKRFGLGTAPNLGLGTERPGLIPTREWKQSKLGQSWQAGETLIAGIGQGFITATPLQLARMCAQLANGGKQVTPRLVLPPDDDGRVGTPTLDTADQAKPLVSPQNLAVVHEGMFRVVNSSRGTAYAARIVQKGLEMAGKSGTSQVKGITLAEREEGLPNINNVPWEEREHAVFIAFAPVGNPRYAIAVLVEHGGGGSSVSGPIARDVLREVQRRDPARKGRKQLAGDNPPGARG